MAAWHFNRQTVQKVLSGEQQLSGSHSAKHQAITLEDSYLIDIQLVSQQAAKISSAVAFILP